jgi:hypothetical protein
MLRSTSEQFCILRFTLPKQSAMTHNFWMISTKNFSQLCDLLAMSIKTIQFGVNFNWLT